MYVDPSCLPSRLTPSSQHLHIEAVTFHFHQHLVVYDTRRECWRSQVVINTSSGLSTTASRVIVTAPLGYLQEHSATLFTPPLPSSTVEALGSMSMGLLNKVGQRQFCRFRLHLPTMLHSTRIYTAVAHGCPSSIFFCCRLSLCGTQRGGRICSPQTGLSGWGMTPRPSASFTTSWPLRLSCPLSSPSPSVTRGGSWRTCLMRTPLSLPCSPCRPHSRKVSPVPRPFVPLPRLLSIRSADVHRVDGYNSCQSDKVSNKCCC